MTTFIPREPYSQAELDKLYPKELELQLVQVLLRHGERTPINPRFQKTGLPPHWPYCNAAKRLSAVILGDKDWDYLQYRRRLETFGTDDYPVLAMGPRGEVDAVCHPGELTDRGRETTFALGTRLRHLYVDQLKFMPHLIADADMILLRATPVPRALHSLQQAFAGFYPPSARTADFPAPSIVTRQYADETLFPNDSHCRRFAQLSRAFADRAAKKWNDTDDMKYLSKVYSKIMPDQAKVAVDSKPRLSGIMDTVNSSDAHGAPTKLPKEFFDPKAREIIDKIAVDEWFSGYNESNEYRMLGIGGLMGDVTSHMIGYVQHNGNDGIKEIGGDDGKPGRGRGGEQNIKFALSGCHDTTLAGVLTSLGAFDGEKWPPFTSHIAIELFRKADKPAAPIADSSMRQLSSPGMSQSWWSSLFGNAKSAMQPQDGAAGITRKPLSDFSEAQKDQLKDHYVRIRYNDKVMQVRGCLAEGKHLEGDTSFCTMEAFKTIVDKYVPKNWREACASNPEAPTFPEKPEPSGI